jgi:hypothetical protein
VTFATAFVLCIVTHCTECRDLTSSRTHPRTYLQCRGDPHCTECRDLTSSRTHPRTYLQCRGDPTHRTPVTNLFETTCNDDIRSPLPYCHPPADSFNFDLGDP